MNQKIIGALLLIFLFAAGPLASTYSAAPSDNSPPGVLASGSAIRGKELFLQKCQRCHTVGRGVKVGPDLKNITAKEPREYLINFIMDPDKLIEENHPIPIELLKHYGIKMPDLDINRQQTLDLLAYFSQPEFDASDAVGQHHQSGERANRRRFFSPLQDTAAVGSSPLQDPSSGNVSAGQGKSLFESKCSSCHTIGGGKLVGPDLKNVTEKRPHEWLVNFIMDPEKMFSQNDPASTQLLNEYGFKMPDLGLTEQQVLDILAYLKNPAAVTAAPAQEEQSKRQAQPEQKPPQEQHATTGDAHTGYLFFTGDISFKSNAIYCKSCHTIGGLPFPYGGRGDLL